MSSAQRKARQHHAAGLPAGVVLRALRSHGDGRGDLTELFRDQQQGTPLPVQWSLTRNTPNVLRGVHVHARNWDYLCVVAGEIVVGLHDFRMPAARGPQSVMLRLDCDSLQMLTIPPGVAHGVYSLGASSYLIGASSYYEPEDHRRCRWNCPELALDWPCSAPELSPADRGAPDYAELKAAFLAATAVVPRRL